MAKDFDYNDERARKPEGIVGYGCIAQFVVFLILLMLCFCSCATNKTLSHAVNHVADSMVVERAQETKDSVVCRDSAVTVKTDSVVTKEDLDEVVTEHIVSFVDTLGQVTTTTDRTVKRKKSTATTQTQSEVESAESSGVQVHSEVNDYDSIVGHWEQQDSTFQTTVTEDNRPWWTRFVDVIEYLFWGALLAVLAWLTYKYIKGK